MKITISPTSQSLAEAAAVHSAQILNRAIERQDSARLVLSTGASQIETLSSLVKQAVDWRKVEVFHLDEYIGIESDHPASFRGYLLDRFVNLVPLKAFHPVSSSDHTHDTIAVLTQAIRRAPIDLALIGIGENAHLAFNDPPADFATQDAYIVVNLDDDCKRQQVREGWFASLDDVPSRAISMSVHQIMLSAAIVSAVPFKVKAKAVKATLEQDVSNAVPATKLREHPDVTLFLDVESASLVDERVLALLS